MGNRLIKLRQVWNLLKVKKRWQRVHFLVPTRHFGSAVTRGYQVSAELNKRGIYSRVFEWSYKPERVREIKDSIFIVLKDVFKGNYEVLSILKRNGNLLLWDPLDSFHELNGDSEAELFDGVILVNKKCEALIAPALRKDCVFGVIPHHWDRRCRVNHAREYRLLYLGDTTPENILKGCVEQVEELHVLKCNSEKIFLDSLDEIAGYSCHFSVRDENLDSFKYKPAMKLSFAGAAGANIILSRDYSNLELLDASYPYYTDSDLKSVKKTVQYSKETYGTKVWHDALDMIKEVKERTSIENIGKEYIRFVKGLVR